MDTQQLIKQLAKDAGPVRPYSPPWLRTMFWLALAMPYVALVVFIASPRSDLAAMMSEPRFVIELVAALATGVAAAVAAFWSVRPGSSGKIFLLPALPLAVWLATIGFGCVMDWIKLGPDGLALHVSMHCFYETAIVGAIPAITMAFMLRRGAPLTPFATAALGGLAAAGVGNFGLRLFHPPDASIMVLVWQFGSVVLLTALASLSGPWLLSWRSTLSEVRRRTAVK